MKYFNILLISFTLMRHTIKCMIYDECTGIEEPDRVVASKKSCVKYVFCDGENSYEAECLPGYEFNEQAGYCDDPAKVKCDIKPNDDVQSIFDENFVSTTRSQQQTTKSVEKTEIDTNLPENDLNESKIPTCPPLRGAKRIQNIANSESCKAFYICYNGHAISMLCPSNMYFNEESGKCELQMPESCQAKYSVRLDCSKGIYDFVPHPTRCEYYFYCVNGYLMIMRCPNNFTWHYERGACVHKSDTKCFAEQHSAERKNN